MTMIIFCEDDIATSKPFWQPVPWCKLIDAEEVKNRVAKGKLDQKHVDLQVLHFKKYCESKIEEASIKYWSKAKV